MKTSLLVSAVVLLNASLALASGSFESKPAYVCGTGDVIAGVDIYANKDLKQFKIVVLSQSDEAGADAEYIAQYTPQDLSDIARGKQVTLVGSSKDSNEFGGGISDAVLLNLKLNGASDDKFDRQSKMAEKGTVISLFCNRGGK